MAKDQALGDDSITTPPVRKVIVLNTERPIQPSEQQWIEMIDAASSKQINRNSPEYKRGVRNASSLSRQPVDWYK